MAGKRKGVTRPATRVIHAGQRPDPTTGAVMQPVYLTSTYRQPALGADWPYTYARGINPTRRALERNLAELEGGCDARCFASGMAAIAAVAGLLEAGHHVIASERVYGGTHRLFEGQLRRHGVELDWVDTADRAAIEAALRPNSRMLFVETPTNPTLALSDLRMAARVARGHGLRLAVDNTFMTPYFQNPLALGADLVVHSTTKFLNGHSDSVGGCVVSKSTEDAERIAWIQNSVGAILSPVDSFLVLRGVKTLALRMERHQENALRIARWLVRQPAVRTVHYPGLPAHPQHRLARRQMSGFGGVLSFDLGTLARVKRFFSRLRIAAPAESLGGVETLASHPATMTHASLSAGERRRLGIGNGLVRLSVGVEDADDLIADLGGALPG